MSRFIFLLISLFYFFTSAHSQCMIEGPSSPCKDGETIYMLNYNSGTGDTLMSSSWTLNPILGTIATASKNKILISWNAEGSTLLQVRFITSLGDTFTCEKTIMVHSTLEFEVYSSINRICKQKDKEYFATCITDLTLFYTDSVYGYNYKWYLDNSQLSSIIHRTELIQFISTGLHILKLIAEDSINGCAYIKEFNVRVFDPPIPKIEVDTANNSNDSITICKDQKLRFLNRTIPYDDNIYTWEIFDSNNVNIYSLELKTPEDFNYLFHSPGHFSVRMTARSCWGCSASTNFYVIVNDLPIVSILCPSVVCQDSIKEVLYEVTDSCGNYQWTVIGSSNYRISGNKLWVKWGAYPSDGYGKIKLKTTGCNAQVCDGETIVEVPILPTITTINGDRSMCTNRGVSPHSVPIWPGASYTWSISPSNNPDLFIKQGEHSNKVFIERDGFNGSFTLKVKVEHPLADCSFEIEDTIYVHYISLESDTICPGTSPQFEFNSHGESFVSARWSFNFYKTTIYNSNQVTIPSGSTLSPGNKKLEVTVKFTNGDSCTTSVNIKVLNLVFVDKPKGPILVCLDSIYSYNVPTTTGLREWNIIGGTILNISSNTFKVNVKWTLSGKNNKYLMIRNKINDCYSPWDTIIVSDYDSDVAIITGNPTPCDDSQELYSISGLADGKKFQWLITPPVGNILASSREGTIIYWPNILRDTTVILQYRDSTCGLHIYEYPIKLKKKSPLSIYNGAVCAEQFIEFSVNAKAMKYIWDFGGDNDTIQTDTNVLKYRFESKGYYNISVKLVDPMGCVIGNFARKLIEVLPTIQPHFHAFDSATGGFINCLTDTNVVIRFEANVINQPNLKYRWFINDIEQTNDTIKTLIRTHPTNYDFRTSKVKLYIDGLICSDTASLLLSVCTPIMGCTALDGVQIINVDTINCTERSVSGEFLQNYVKFINDTVKIPKGNGQFKTKIRKGYWMFQDKTNQRIDIIKINDLIDQPHNYLGAGYWNIDLVGNARDQSDTTKICRQTDTRVVYIPYTIDFIHTFTCSDSGYNIMLKSLISYQDNMSPTQYKYIIDGVEYISPNGIEELPIHAGTQDICLEVTYDGTTVCSKCITITPPAELLSPNIKASDTFCINTLIEFDIEDADFTNDIVDYVWVFDNTDTSRIRRPQRSFNVAKQYKVQLFVTNRWGCSNSVIDSIFFVSNNLTGTITVDSMPCASQKHLSFVKTTGREPLNYLWNTNDTIQDIYVNKSGDYKINVTDSYGCNIELKKSIELTESFLGDLTGPQSICANDIYPSFSFIGNTSLYDYTLTEKLLPNGSDTTRTLSGTNDLYKFIINLTNKSGTYRLTIKAKNKNSQTICDSVVQNLEIFAVQKPEIVDSFYSCRPFLYLLKENTDRQIDWYNLIDSELFTIGKGSNINVQSGGAFVGIYTNENGCAESDTILLEEQLNLRTFISGCYDVCDTVLEKGHVYIPMLDDNRIYKSWKYVHADSNNIIKQGTDSKVDSFLLQKRHEGKMYLVAEDYNGCIDSSDLLCLTILECLPAVDCDNFTMTCPHLAFTKDSFDCTNMMGYYEVNGEIVVGGDYDLCTPNPLEIKNFIWVVQPTLTRTGNIIRIEGGVLKMHVDSCTGFIDIYVRLCKNGSECKKLLEHYDLECYDNTCGLLSVITTPQTMSTTRIQAYGYIDNTANCGSTYNYIKVVLLKDDCQQQIEQKFVQKTDFNKFNVYFDVPNDSLRNCYCLRVSLCSNQNNCLSSCDIPYVCNGSSQLKSSGGSNSTNMDIECVGTTMNGTKNYTFDASFDDNQYGIYMDSVYIFNNESTQHYCNEGDCSGSFSADSTIHTINTRFLIKFPDYPNATLAIDTSYSLPNCNNSHLIRAGNNKYAKIDPKFKPNKSILDEQSEFLTVVPNPAKDFFRINYYLSDQSAEYKFRILDFKGNLIEEFASNRNASFLDMTITNYPAGLYFVSLVKNSAIRKAQRLIIIK